jgi:hypothetical protein
MMEKVQTCPANYPRLTLTYRLDFNPLESPALLVGVPDIISRQINMFPTQRGGKAIKAACCAALKTALRGMGLCGENEDSVKTSCP